MEKEPRPSENCGACQEKYFEAMGFSECQCSCHVVGNYMIKYHHHFNYIDTTWREEEFVEHTVLRLGNANSVI